MIDVTHKLGFVPFCTALGSVDVPAGHAVDAVVETASIEVLRVATIKLIGGIGETYVVFNGHAFADSLTKGGI